MNPSLKAMITKLSWQLQEFDLHLHEIKNQSHELHQKIKQIDDVISQAHFNSLIINPDFEINRLNFVTQQQEKREELITTLKNNQETEAKLNDKIQRAKMELKMLEKYTEKETEREKQQQKKILDNALDEWVIQKRDAL